MNIGFSDKKIIKEAAGTFVIVFGIFVGVLLVRTGGRYFSRANIDNGGISSLCDYNEPQDVTSGLIFKADFDSGLNASEAKGDTKANPVGTIETLGGIEGNAISVDTNNYVRYKTDGNLKTDSGTISLWVSPRDWTTAIKSSQMFFSTDNNSTTKWLLLYKFWNSDQILMLSGDRPSGPFNQVPYDASSWLENDWHHIVATWGDNVSKFYVDGVLAGTSNYSDLGQENIGSEFLLGGNILNFRNPYGKTLLDDFRIYDNNLSDEEILSLYNYVRKEKGRVVNWNFEEIKEGSARYWESKLVKGNGEILVNNTDKLRGDHSLQIKLNKNNSSLVAVPQKIDLSEIGQYGLCVWYKNSSAESESTAKINLVYNDAFGKKIENSSLSYELTKSPQWNNFSTVFMVPEDAVSLNLELALEGKPDSVLFDSVVVDTISTVEPNYAKDKYSSNHSPSPGYTSEIIENLSVDVQSYNGKPTVLLNGNPAFLSNYQILEFNEAEIAAVRDAGVHTYLLSNSYQGFGMLGWVGEGQYDYSNVDDLLRRLVDIDPKARIIPLVWVTAYRQSWWADQNPSELAMDEGGNNVLNSRFYGNIKVESLSSDKWRTDSGNAIREFVNHIENGPYADRVVGYYVTSLISREWQNWGMGEGNFMIDYSLPSVESFRDWLRQKYITESSLQTSWRDLNVNFNNAQIPSSTERKNFSKGNLNDPQINRKAIDYYDFVNNEIASLHNYYNEIVKTETGNTKLTGSFYGYTIEPIADGLRRKERGHLGVMDVFNTGNYDLPTSIVSYVDRQPGKTGSIDVPVASLALKNLIPVVQVDQRTYLSKEKEYYGNVSLKPKTLTDTVNILIRDYAMLIANNAFTQFYEFNNGWLTKDKRLLDIVGYFYKLGQVISNNATLDQSGSIAVVVNERSALYGWQQRFQNPYSEYARVGVPVKYYYLSDLLSHPEIVSRHKIFVFEESYYMGDEEYNFVKNNLRGDGRVLVWKYAPGLLNETNLSIQRSSDLVGFNLQLSDTFTYNDVALTQNQLNDGVDYYPQNIRHNPYVWIEDNTVDVLGTFADGKVGAAMHDFGNWKSVYIPSDYLPFGLLRNIAKSQQEHVYMDSGDAIYVGNNLIVVHANTAGTKNIKLPGSFTVYDMLRNEQIGINLTEFSFEMSAKETRVFLFGDNGFVNKIVRESSE